MSSSTMLAGPLPILLISSRRTPSAIRLAWPNLLLKLHAGADYPKPIRLPSGEQGCSMILDGWASQLVSGGSPDHSRRGSGSVCECIPTILSACWPDRECWRDWARWLPSITSGLTARATIVDCQQACYHLLPEYLPRPMSTMQCPSHDHTVRR